MWRPRNIALNSKKCMDFQNGLNDPLFAAPGAESYRSFPRGQRVSASRKLWRGVRRRCRAAERLAGGTAAPNQSARSLYQEQGSRIHLVQGFSVRQVVGRAFPRAAAVAAAGAGALGRG